jgi:hypothetical protein
LRSFFCCCRACAGALLPSHRGFSSKRCTVHRAVLWPFLDTWHSWAWTRIRGVLKHDDLGNTLARSLACAVILKTPHASNIAHIRQERRVSCSREPTRVDRMPRTHARTHAHVVSRPLRSHELPDDIIDHNHHHRVAIWPTTPVILILQRSTVFTSCNIVELHDPIKLQTTSCTQVRPFARSQASAVGNRYRALH